MNCSVFTVVHECWLLSLVETVGRVFLSTHVCLPVTLLACEIAELEETVKLLL